MRKHPASALIAGLVATLVIFAPGLAWALGLGQIQSETRIGQNLKARIPILAANPNALQGLTVGLARPDAYQQAGIREADFLFNLKFQVKQGAKGPYVLITSTQPVRLPFLNILVHAHWASGEVTRQYTLLLNPPVFAAAGSKQAKSGAPVATPSTPARQGPIERPTAPPPARPAPPPAQSHVVQNPAPAGQTRPGAYGPVRRGQTLWGIANGLRTGASVNQMMIAIYRANPQAFSGNIDRLKAGATLRLPSREEVAQISRPAANAEVADQVKSWKAHRPGAENRVAKAAAPGHPASKRAGGAGQAAANGAGNAAGVSPSSHAGEVVLTAPKVTQSVAASGGAASTRSGVGATAAAGALAAAGAAHNGKAGKETKGGGSARAAAIPAASAGGPAKVHNAELANLAAGAAKKQTAANTRAHGVTHGGHNAKAGAGNKPGRSHAAVKTSTASRLSGTVWNWLTSPKGWIIIAVIVIFLILIIFLLFRRHRRREQALMALATDASAAAPPQHHEAPVRAAADAGVPAGETFAAVPDDGDVTAVPGKAKRMEEVEAAANETAVPDALAQADLHAGHGDYAGAARVLSGVLETVPERNDVRVRLLEMLFAQDDGPAFLAAAEQLHRRIPESGTEWRSVAVMGRELLPDEALFAESGEAGERSLDSALAGDAEMNHEEAGEPDFDFELDQLNESESEDTGLSDDFEHTLGELSTMIETYMPEGGERPVELHLPPGRAAAVADEEIAAPDETDVVLDLDVGSPAAQAEAERTDERSRLELAQAYLDMEDRESARATLEDLLTDGDAAQREQARRMLDTMDGELGDGLSGERTEAFEPVGESGEPILAEEVPPEADEPGTAMDLARAYLELGDRESARDILEEILDGDSEPQREKARELLETLN